MKQIKINAVNFLFRNEDECAHFYNENKQRAAKFSFVRMQSLDFRQQQNKVNFRAKNCKINKSNRESRKIFTLMIDV